MFEDVQDRATSGLAPGEFIGLRAIMGSLSDQNLVIVEVFQDTVGAAQLFELVEKQTHHILGL
jgi:hypothetical protein